MIKAVIFDMDGVLIDAKEWHYEALNQALRLFGHEISRFEHVTAYDGLPTRKKLEMLTRQRGLPASLHGFINEMKQAYTMDAIHAHCRPTFAHEYALSRLKGQGYRLGVASNSIRATVEAMMARAALDPYLEFKLSNEDVCNGKPDPEIYLKAISLLGLTPDACLVVEDNENGLKAARASGAHVMQVETVHDVNLENILRYIQSVDSGVGRQARHA
jgi:beta-phosphoglucomutase-like phosphatase (HAD superfamily)